MYYTVFVANSVQTHYWHILNTKFTCTRSSKYHGVTQWNKSPSSNTHTSEIIYSNAPTMLYFIFRILFAWLDYKCILESGLAHTTVMRNLRSLLVFIGQVLLFIFICHCILPFCRPMHSILTAGYTQQVWVFRCHVPHTLLMHQFTKQGGHQ